MEKQSLLLGALLIILGLHLLRASCGLFSYIAFSYAVVNISLIEATLFRSSAPLALTVNVDFLKARTIAQMESCHRITNSSRYSSNESVSNGLLSAIL